MNDKLQHNQNGKTPGPNATTDTSTYEWNDRLVERGLEEVLGNESPPDLSERILNALASPNETTVLKSDPIESNGSFSRMRLMGLLAIAGSVMTLGAFLFLSDSGQRMIGLATPEKSAQDHGGPPRPILRDVEQRAYVVANGKGLAGEGLAGKGLANVRWSTNTASTWPDADEGRSVEFGLTDLSDGDLPAQLAQSPEPQSVSQSGTARTDRLSSLANSSSSVRYKHLSQQTSELSVAPSELSRPTDGSGLESKYLDALYSGYQQLVTEQEFLSAVEESGRPAPSDAHQNPYESQNLSASELSTTLVNKEIVERLDVSESSDKDRWGLPQLTAADNRGSIPSEASVRERRHAMFADALGMVEKEQLGVELKKAQENLKEKLEQNIDVYFANDSEAIKAYLDAKRRYESFGRFQKPAPLHWPGDRYAKIHDNPFRVAKGETAFSTFSIDVDTASYTNVRQFITQNGCLPPPNAVRIEELVNYFDYDYAPPSAGDLPSSTGNPGNTENNDKQASALPPFAAHVEVASCPWQPKHRLVRVGLKGQEVATDQRPLSNLVFLVDVSGSMNNPAKLPLVVDGLRHMTRELGENDRVAIVVYASSEGLALPSTNGTQQDVIQSVLGNLAAGGSTAGGAGIQLAYKVAEDNFIQGGVNRVILCTDGDFNVGVSDTNALQQLAEQKAAETKVFLTVLGFGRGNLNDEMMEAISNKGNGTYHYIDNLREARRVLVDQMSGTLVTIAKDVKIQVEFNPAKVKNYRLIGYENRILAKEDFNDDTKDAGEIGAGHTVTAIYQVCPKGVEVKPAAKPVELPVSRYQKPTSAEAVTVADVDADTNRPIADDDDGLTEAAMGNELLTLAIRYKPPTEDVSTKLDFLVDDSETSYKDASEDFKFAASVASFGMLMRRSEHAGDATLDSVLKLAEEGLGADEHGYRTEFIEIVRKAKSL